MSERLCVVMPVYNEQEAVGSVLEKWAKALDALDVDYTIRPYNDGSKDDSLVVMKSVAAHLPHVEVRDKPNGGHGNTILTGYRDAAKDGFDWVFQIDSDDEMGPEKFKELWVHRESCDFLIGIRDGRVQPLARKIISFVSRLCVRIFYGKSVWDVNTPYRLMRVSAFRPFYDEIPLTTFAPNVILSGLAARHNLRSFEIRVPQHDRTTGEVSIKKLKLLKAAVRSFVQTILFSFRPVKIGSLVAIVLFVGSTWLYASNPFAKCSPTDGAVFMYIGDVMHAGGVPYRDVFDHKGPLLYFINYLASGCGSSLTYLWLLECLCWLVSFVLVFRLTRRWISDLNPVWALLPYTALSFWFLMEHSSNLTESWAQPFILFVILAIFDSILGRKTLSWVKSLWIGVCTMAILLLRPNLAAIGFVAALYWFDVILRKDGVKTFVGKLSAAFLGGFLLLLPFVTWYGAKGALLDLWNCYISFNLAYVGGGGAWNNEVYICIALIAINLIGIMKERGCRRKALVYNLIFQVLSIGVILIKPGVRHYFLAFVPASALPIVCGVAFLRRAWSRNIVTVLSLIVLVICFLRANFDIGEYVHSVRGGESVFNVLKFREGYSNTELRKFLPYIKDRNSVCVLGNACWVYRYLGVKTGFRFPYQDPIRKVSASIDEAVRAYIHSGRSSCFIAQSYVERGDLAALLDEQYMVVDRCKEYVLYVRKVRVDE